MSVLETFYILFKSDTSEVKKGADEAERATRKLQDGLTGVGRESAVVGREFATAARSVVGLFAGIASVGAVISSLRSSVSEVSQIGNISRNMQVNTEALDAWGHAAQRTGGSAQGFQSSLSSLASHLNTTNAVALKTLPVLANALSKMNQAQANRYGKSLGLDQSTIYLLQRGRREVEDLIKQQQKLGLVTENDVKLTREFDNALYDAGRAFSTFYRQLAVPTLPFLTGVVESLIEHKDFVIGALIAIGAAGAVLAAPFVTANAAIILTTASVGALIAAFALVFEDIKGFMSGMDSVTGRIKQGFDKAGEDIKSWGDKLPDWVKKATGYQALAPAAAEPLARALPALPGFTPGVPIASAGMSQSRNNIDIGEINIITQATDSNGISQDISKHLNDHMQQTIGTFDSGVRI